MDDGHRNNVQGSSKNKEQKKKNIFWWMNVMEQSFLISQYLFNYSKQLPIFNDTQGSVTVFWWVHQQSLSWATWIKSTPYHPISSRSILILFFHLQLELTSGFLPSGMCSLVLVTIMEGAFLLHYLSV